MSSHPTSKARKKRQKLRRKFAKLREDCQLAGIIETTPEGALRDERVPPSAQEEDLRGLPTLVMEALRNGWEVSDAKKPGLVEQLIAIVRHPEMPANAKIAAFKALLVSDARAK